MTSLALFPYTYFNVATENPVSSLVIQFGNGYDFTASPEAPDQRTFTLEFTALRWFRHADGTLDHEVNHSTNMANLTDFYRSHKLHKPFQFVHPVYGLMSVRFKTPLKEPLSRTNGRGMTEPFSIDLIEYQPAEDLAVYNPILSYQTKPKHTTLALPIVKGTIITELTIAASDINTVKDNRIFTLGTTNDKMEFFLGSAGFWIVLVTGGATSVSAALPYTHIVGTRIRTQVSWDSIVGDLKIWVDGASLYTGAGESIPTPVEEYAFSDENGLLVPSNPEYYIRKENMENAFVA